MKKLLCIDPGGKGKGQTGIVLLSFDDDTAPVALDSWAVTGGLDGFLDWANEFRAEIGVTRSAPEHVVIEHFVNHNAPGADLTPVLIEGAALTLFQDYHVHVQAAAGKNSMMPDRVLQELGLWFTGDNHHDRREAARHGLIWLRNRLHKPTIMQINPGVFKK